MDPEIKLPGLIARPKDPSEPGRDAPAAPVYDLVVYGATSAGLMAAIQAARFGLRTVLIAHDNHVGGLTTSGLGASDYGEPEAVGGLAREFHRRLYRHYLHPRAWVEERREDYEPRHWLSLDDATQTHWFFEPSAARRVVAEMLQETEGLDLVFGERLALRGAGGVRKSGARIEAAIMESGRRFSGRIFIDATYEGDLMAKAGVSYTLGRESNDQYGETLNGVRPPLPLEQTSHLDPYIVPGQPASGLLPGIELAPPGVEGDGDRRIQAYNFRLCLTDAPANRLPISKPEGYDPIQYELLARQIRAHPDLLPGHALIRLTPMPNRKTDGNNCGIISTDLVGGSRDWAECDYETRAQIWQTHRNYTEGFLWFLTHDPRMPESLRREMARWGLARDEFEESGHWPPQLYVREARRMIGQAVMTEQDCRGLGRVTDPIGLGSYTIDCHQVTRYVTASGQLAIEGGLGAPVRPYPISYGAILPLRNECVNLLVPVCLSATHVAFGSLRMEPVFMILGQSAAIAARLAIEQSLPLQDLPYQSLRNKLVEAGQVLEHVSPPEVESESARPLPRWNGLIVDDDRAELTGYWAACSHPRSMGLGYRHDGNTGKGEKSASYLLPVEQPGTYQVEVSYVPHPNRADNVPVSIEAGDGVNTVILDQSRPPPVEGAFASLGTFRFEDRAVVTISNAGTNGYVAIDAVRLVWAG